MQNHIHLYLYIVCNVLWEHELDTTIVQLSSLYICYYILPTNTQVSYSLGHTGATYKVLLATLKPAVSGDNRLHICIFFYVRRRGGTYLMW